MTPWPQRMVSSRIAVRQSEDGHPAGAATMIQNQAKDGAARHLGVAAGCSYLSRTRSTTRKPSADSLCICRFPRSQSSNEGGTRRNRMLTERPNGYLRRVASVHEKQNAIHVIRIPRGREGTVMYSGSPTRGVTWAYFSANPDAKGPRRIRINPGPRALEINSKASQSRAPASCSRRVPAPWRCCEDESSASASQLLRRGHEDQSCRAAA